ncbi:MAG TPA: PfkB family carbohydrate kinase [Polyangiaceae bacterium]|jgi:sugar/nucleoside kinase (ribokinase family)|nr:PfkB family carbohydrate kinase [Polyangiaceae bacterium]
MTTEQRPASDALLIVGSMAFDDLDLPSGSERDVVGGSATYAAVAATLYTQTRVVAVVGDDFPSETVSMLEGRGVDCAGIERAKGKTFRWAGRYAPNLASRETLDTQLNVFADFRPKLPEHYRDSKIVLLGNIHPALQLEVLAQTRSPKLVVADTMNFWISGERKALLQVLAKVDALVVNDEELRELSGEHNLKRGARAVLAMGPKLLVVKRGDAGAMLFDGDGTFFAPAYPLETEMDPTGAGDTFAGAILGFLARAPRIDHAAWRQALLVGATVASFCVEGVGNRALVALTHVKLAARLKELHALLSVES